MENHFKEIQRKNLNFSDYMCFVRTVRERVPGTPELTRMFRKLVPKTDYSESDFDKIITHLISPRGTLISP